VAERVEKSGKQTHERVGQLKKTHATLFSVIISLLIISCGGNGYYGGQDPWGWGPMIQMHYGYGGMFMWVLFLILIGLLVYFIIQAAKTKGQAQTQTEGPLDILKKRYARGEITKEDFDRMKKDLES